MKRIVVLFFIILAVMLQLAVFSRFQLQAGKIDLILLVVIAWSLQSEISRIDIFLVSIFSGFLIGFISVEPFWLVISVYLLATIFSIYLKYRFVQIPILSMFLSAVLFTLFHLLASMFVYQISGAVIDFKIGFEKVILPSLLLSIIASIPVYLVVSEIRRLTFPGLEEI
jgi:hypothetical protein